MSTIVQHFCKHFVWLLLLACVNRVLPLDALIFPVYNSNIGPPSTWYTHINTHTHTPYMHFTHIPKIVISLSHPYARTVVGSRSRTTERYTLVSAFNTQWETCTYKPVIVNCTQTHTYRAFLGSLVPLLCDSIILFLFSAMNEHANTNLVCSAFLFRYFQCVLCVSMCFLSNNSIRFFTSHEKIKEKKTTLIQWLGSDFFRTKIINKKKIWMANGKYQFFCTSNFVY